MAFFVDEIFFRADVGAAHREADFQEVQERVNLVDVVSQFRQSVGAGDRGRRLGRARGAAPLPGEA